MTPGLEMFGPNVSVVEGEIVGSAGQAGKVLAADDPFLLARAPLNETVKTVAASGSAYTIKLSEGPVHDIKATAASVAVTLPEPVVGGHLTTLHRQDAAGGRAWTFVGAHEWGLKPEFSVAANAVDIVYWECFDGTHWVGFPAAYGISETGPEPAVTLAGLNAKEDAANKTAASSSSVTTYPNWKGVTDAIAAAISAATALMIPKAGSIWTPSDYGYSAWTGDPNAFSTSSPLPEAGRLEVIRIKIAEATELEKLFLGLVTVGSSDLANCFVAFYQEGKLLVQSADQTSQWKTGGATGRKEIVMPSKKAVKAGFLDVVIWVGSGTTMPTFARGTGSGGTTPLLNAGLTAENSRYASADTGKTTTAPENLGAKTGRSLAWWAAVA